ncbi:hypothetical protein EJ04DRAFT_1967 [Polyplosphaeria fusca]|uniref:Uncharacterized protein n=1 Tax=Polyplosphaeria fusca TaxID=682080 RepID=A0A9P4R932_9PLEO|nr:hypothetical protein EJ04DRAFT_1967 [Polyplosphaeria fusca]
MTMGCPNHASYIRSDSAIAHDALYFVYVWIVLLPWGILYTPILATVPLYRVCAYEAVARVKGVVE